ncbi:MAG TPA: nitroreductase family deazaflavin-dependent oxidoreductase [Thermoleophilaceae bacterium]|jgi:deazaflavin-dependent oxidoreductase (nitroreductase family)
MHRYEEANLFRRIVRRTAATRPVAWLYARTLHHIDRLVYRLSGRRATFASWVSGLPIVMLTTTGARSGRERTLPLVAIPTDDGMVVIASNFGQRTNPSWYYNLRAEPRARIAFDGATREVVARQLLGDEREHWFARGVEIYPGWVDYRRRASHRHIPVLRLEPVAA